jgi:hypothetical protein
MLRNMPKLNCWELKKCKRIDKDELRDDDDLGVCRVYTEKFLDGLNDGKNGGRICWIIDSALCDEKLTTGFIINRNFNCQNCEFYKLVREEQGEKFKESVDV